MKKLILVTLLLTIGISVVAFSAEKITWLSTQFNPIKEAEWVRQTLLPPFTQATGVEVTFIGSEYAPFVDRLTAEAKAGKGTIDVVCGLHGDFASTVGALSDVSNVAVGGSISPGLMKLGQMEGKQVYIPLMQATYLMTVNKKALEYLPEGADIWSLTYDQLLAWAKNIYDATGEKKLGIPAGPGSLLHRFIHGYLYPSFTGYQVLKFDSPEAVEMWEYMKELWQYVNPAAPTWDSMDTPLLSGDVWIAWDHTARLKPAIVQQPDEFIAIPSPAGPAGRAFITVIAGLGIPKTSPNPEAAAKLIKYLTSPDAQVSILQGVGFFPVVSEAANAVPSGALQILAKGVSAQASSPDAIVSFIPSGISDEYKKIYRDTFTQIVIQGKDIKSVLLTGGQALRKLYLDSGAPYPAPDNK
ncbi:carbohydrate ABC transporter substrate-binding protein [Candidatus Acetothermia bacterium]|nr:extracellular solute-binding protein [Candidatus Bipolaricaulota bacterium]RLE40127.1 MAG: carbohydrate ABC transporter substrate-binding protein [Candidatus Acetothermia bacterium]